MKLKGKIQEKRTFGFTILTISLLCMLFVPVVNAEEEPGFPEYIESVTPNISVDIRIVTDEETQSGPDNLVGVTEDECEMTQTILISQYDIEEIFSMCRFSNVASMSEYKPTMFGIRSVEPEYLISESIAQAVQISSTRSDIISQAITRG